MAVHKKLPLLPSPLRAARPAFLLLPCLLFSRCNSCLPRSLGCLSSSRCHYSVKLSAENHKHLNHAPHICSSTCDARRGPRLAWYHADLCCAPQDLGSEDAWVLQPMSHRSGAGSTSADTLALEAALEPVAVGGVNASSGININTRNGPNPKPSPQADREPLDGNAKAVVISNISDAGNIRTVFPPDLVPAFLLTQSHRHKHRHGNTSHSVPT